MQNIYKNNFKSPSYQKDQSIISSKNNNFRKLDDKNENIFSSKIFIEP
jgi:hypothetical protein